MRVTGPVQLISTATCPSVQEREQIRSRVDWSIYSHFQLVPLKPACPNSTQSFSSLSHFHISSPVPSVHSIRYRFPCRLLLRPRWVYFLSSVAFPDVRHVYPNLLLLRYPHTPHRDSLATSSLSVSRAQPLPSLDSTTCAALRSVIQVQTQTRLLQRPHTSVELTRSKIRPL